jgi:hypothetical protein
VSKDKNISRQLSKQEIKAIFEAKSHLAASGKIIDNVAKMVRGATKV